MLILILAIVFAGPLSALVPGCCVPPGPARLGAICQGPLRPPGASTTWPPLRRENSLAAFRRAAERGLGRSWMSILLADGALAVVHDSSLRRVCGIDRRSRTCGRRT